MRDSARRDVLQPKSSQKHPRNVLNDLSGAQWVYFLNSVDITSYPVSGAEGYGHHLRKAHPSPKPPQLMRRLIEFFTKEGGWVLDPFAGVGGTLLGCSLAGRHGVGIELEPTYVDIYATVCAYEGLLPQTALVGDARYLGNFASVTAQPFDLILTDPPYSLMMTRKQNGEKKKKRGSEAPTPFSSRVEDIGNLSYQDFLVALREIIHLALPCLKEKGYLVLFAKDLQPTREHHNMLHADIVLTLSALPGLFYKGYKIWYDKTVNLYPFGYPHTFVANQLHQYILIFRKEQATSKQRGSVL